MTSTIDSFLAGLRSKVEAGQTHADVMAETDAGEFARMALDELAERGTTEILDFGALAGDKATFRR